jgi:hypothetical protein
MATMAKKDDDSRFDEDWQNERITQVVKDTFVNHPKDWVNKLEEGGFTWVDDGYGKQEELDEQNAIPVTLNQEYLVAYFVGSVELDQKVLEAFESEKSSELPNYPLIRRYFKQGNPNLKRLLLFGISKAPTNLGFLSDLSFFNEFSPILPEMIELYINAGVKEESHQAFEELVRDFYCATVGYDFDAFHALAQLFLPGTDKRSIVDRVQQEEETFAKEGVKF